MNFKKYKRKGLSEMVSAAEFILNGGDMTLVSISKPDEELAKEEPFIFEQGYIARNPKNHEDMWYVAKKYFDDNLEPAEPATETFMDRLIRERDELQDKLTKLEAFLANKTKAIEISGMEQYNLLIKQVDVMYDYLAILNERINKLQATID
jgi:hypothetical protein